jgi:hypothetical protein
MEPIAIALVISVLFNLYCFNKIKTYIKETKDLEDKLSNSVPCDYKQPKVESLGFVNVYIKPNGNHIISSIPRSKWEIKRKRSQHPINMLLGTSEVFITKPEK